MGQTGSWWRTCRRVHGRAAHQRSDHLLYARRPDGIPEVQDAFDEGLLGPLTFERRINVVMLIAPHVLSSDEVAALKADLSELRTLRNAMAHKPFWFHPELNDEGEVVNLVPLIMRGKAPLPLTTPFMERVNALIAGLIEKTANLAAAVVKRSLTAGLTKEGLAEQTASDKTV
jgi:hypothetical protein